MVASTYHQPTAYADQHHPIYRDRLNVDVKQVQSEIEERLAELREAGIDLLARAMPALIDLSASEG